MTACIVVPSNQLGQWGAGPILRPDRREGPRRRALIDFLSRQLGHTDIRTTLRFYARYIPALEERHLAMLNEGWRTMTPISTDA